MLILAGLHATHARNAAAQKSWRKGSFSVLHRLAPSINQIAVPFDDAGNVLGGRL